MISNEGLEQLDAAVREVESKHRPGDLVIGWVLVAVLEPSDDDDGNIIDIATPPGQPAHSSIGLLSIGHAIKTSARTDS